MVLFIIIYYQNWIISLTLNLTAQVSILYYYTHKLTTFSFDHLTFITYILIYIIYIYKHNNNNNALITAVDTKRGAWQCVSTIFPRRRAKTVVRGWSAKWWSGGPVSSANHYSVFGRPEGTGFPEEITRLRHDSSRALLWRERYMKKK